MTTYTWPNNDSAFRMESVVRKSFTLSDESESPLNGNVITDSRPGSRWGWTLTIPEQTWDERERLAAFLVRLNGRQHRVAFVNPARRVPNGTVPLSGVVTNAAATQFGETLSLATGVAGCTVLRGDWFRTQPAGLSFQLCMCVADATANGSGIITVEFRHALRSAFPSGTPVNFNAPSAFYVLGESSISIPYDGSAAAPSFSFDLIESFTQ